MILTAPKLPHSVVARPPRPWPLTLRAGTHYVPALTVHQTQVRVRPLGFALDLQAKARK